jgi:predicted negative regulator of RcsB-dependent stress response
MKRLGLIPALLVAVLAAGGALAQDNKKDGVTLVQKGGATTRVTGTVLSETWKGVELDKNGDGQADASYDIDQVLRVEYARRPQYLTEAQKLSYPPRELIDKLTRAYNDDSTPMNVLQHAYYLIAKSWAELAKADPSQLPKAVDAYNKLFTKMPDTRYAVSGRIELGSLQLSFGKPDQAVATFRTLAEGGFGPAVTRRGRLLMARAQLSGGSYEDAERSLTLVAEGLKMNETEMAQEVKLLKSRSLVGQKKFDEAWRGITEILAQNPSKKTLAMAYGVMGDYFAAKDDHRTALTAYLKVPLMYGEADAVEKAEAVRQAGEMLKKLGRAKDIELLTKAPGE